LPPLLRNRPELSKYEVTPAADRRRLLPIVGAVRLILEGRVRTGADIQRYGIGVMQQTVVIKHPTYINGSIASDGNHTGN